MILLFKVIYYAFINNYNNQQMTKPNYESKPNYEGPPKSQEELRKEQQQELIRQQVSYFLFLFSNSNIIYVRIVIFIDIQ